MLPTAIFTNSSKFLVMSFTRCQAELDISMCMIAISKEQSIFERIGDI